ncbi:MAG: hypothetical protein GX386_01510 [Clostridiaceae bacterium]|jgi:hypothetical protein|nr:hypothetical protein [Clostridiaceae bacterium]
MINKLKSENGSSTILIALLLVTLVVFALLSLTTSASELRLAQKNAYNNKTYYMLDSEGKRFLYEVKSKIKDALIISRDRPELFFNNLDILLGEKIIRSVNYGNDATSMTIQRTIIFEENSRRKYLEIKLLISQPTAESRINDICSVTEWRLWQEDFEFNNTIDLWEGIP